MGVRGSLELIRSLDAAWNERRWDDVAAVLGDDMTAFSASRCLARSKDEYLYRSIEFCEAFPNATIHVKPYLTLFASHDGRFCCSVARVTGSQRKIRTRIRHRFDVVITSCTEIRDGQVRSRRGHIDIESIRRAAGMYR